MDNNKNIDPLDKTVDDFILEAKKATKDIIISEPKYDDSEAYEFRLLYILNQDGYLYSTNCQTKETVETKLNKLGSTSPTDLFALSEEDNNYIIVKLIDSKIENTLSQNGKSSYDKEEAESIREKLVMDIAKLSKDEYFKTRFELIRDVDNETIKEQINKADENITNAFLSELEKEISEKAESRTSLNKLYQLLGQYLNEIGVILRKNTRQAYLLDKENNGYYSVTIDDILYELSKIFGKNKFSDEDVKKALGFVHERLEPVYNVVKMGNCLYSMDEHKPIKSDKPVFTIIETKYNYNPKAEPTYVKDFLYSSLARLKKDGKTDEKATEEAVKGVLQLIGYLFVSGNPRLLLAFLVGVSGSGKTLLCNIIAGMFGTKKVSDVKLQDLSKGGFSTSQLLDSTVNIIRDMDDTPVLSNGTIKQLTGYEDIGISKKYCDDFMLPKEEVPTMIGVCNNMPAFKKMERALSERMGIIEFFVKFRGTEDEDRDLEKNILNNDEDMEWLIYNALEAFREMCEEGKDFNFRINPDHTRELSIKHSNPLSYIIRKLITRVDEEAYDNAVNIMNFTDSDPYVIPTELNELCRIVAEDEGIELPLTDNGIISPRKLVNAIRYAFDLDDWVDKYGNEYSTKVVKVKGKATRVYPALIKSELYNSLALTLSD